MTYGDAIGVRLDSKLRSRLQAVSDQTGMTGGDLIRNALRSYLDAIQEKGALILPVSISEPMSVAESRATYPARQRAQAK